MSIVTMDMSGFEIERNHSVAYDDEVLCADWNSTPTLQHQTLTREHNVLPQDMIAVDTEAFLQRMYAYQQQ